MGAAVGLLPGSFQLLLPKLVYKYQARAAMPLALPTSQWPVTGNTTHSQSHSPLELVVHLF